MKKGLAIKIASGVLVVALVVVVALAISGVFSAKKGSDGVVVRAEDASASNVVVLRDVPADKVFYVESGVSIGDIGTYVEVRANGSAVALKLSDKRDEAGHVGFTAKNGWASGVAYRVTLKSNDIAFVEDQYAGMTSFIFIVDAPESTVANVTKKAFYLKEGDYTLTGYDQDEEGNFTSWTLIVKNVEEAFAADTVFIRDDKINVESFRNDGILNSYAWVLDPNTEAVYNAETKEYSATVKNASVDEVFDELNVHTTIDPTEENFVFDQDATAAAIFNSDLYLATVQYLYGEELGSMNWKVGDYGKLVLDYDFKVGSPTTVKLDATLSFSGFLKSAKNATVTIKIANVLTPTFHANFQKNPLAFDASLNITVDTTVSVDGSFAYSFDNTDDENNTEANVALKNIVNQVSSIVKDALGTENKTSKPFIFATWVIPVGTTPIQIVESMGLEVKAEVKAKIGASIKNTFTAEVGLVYCDDNITPIANVKDDFKIGQITLWGTLETKVGLYNQIGITACGIVSVNLGASVGAYCDVAGRLEMEGWEIMNGKFNIDPAYYIEAGIYLDINVNGKVLIFNIKQQDLLNKKWPLWSTGYKYIPQYDPNSASDAKYLATEDVYMSGSYFFFTTFETRALDIQNLNDTMGTERSINWDEFDYSFDQTLLKMDGNKVKVTTTAPNAFETDIIVTSKCNKSWKKTIHVIKTPEAPTVIGGEKKYEKSSRVDLDYGVRINSSKFIGLTSKAVNVSESDYVYEDDVLTLKANFLESLPYGRNELLFESSKGYAQVFVTVYTNKDIVPAEGFATQNFDKANPKNVEFSIDLLGGSITKIDNLNDSDWVYAQGKLKIFASALFENEAGEVANYRVHFDTKRVDENKQPIYEDAVLSINVIDNRAPVFKTTVYEYKIGSQAELKLDVELYGKTITDIMIGGKSAKNTYWDNETKTIDPRFFTENSFAGTTLNSYIQVGSYKKDFTVKLYTSNTIAMPVKYVEYDKASGKDVTLYASIPDGIGVTCDDIDNARTLGSNFYAEDGVIGIKAQYLANLSVGAYKFQIVSAADNAPEFIINVVSSKGISVDTAIVNVKKGVDVERNVAWDLADVAIEDVEIVGLTDAQYRKESNKLVLIVDELDYGTTAIKVITNKNAFDITVNVEGTVRFLKKDYTLIAGQDLVIKTDLAGKTLEEIKFVKDGKEVEIVRTQFRNNNGIITISNDYAYNLAKGSYAISIYTVEGDVVSGATLNVAGELTSYTGISEEIADGSSDKPYLIYNKAQFISFIEDTNKKAGAESFEGVYFKLMSDIDLENATINPIGKKGAPFKGGFDGNGYTIKNFKIDDVNNDYTGLFAYNAGAIQDLRLSNVTVDVSKAGSVGIGLVVGYNTGSLQNVSVSNGKINAVSKSWMDIKNAYFDIGGLVGYNDGGNLSKCKCVVEINAEVKGLSIAGLNIGGRKSCINVGAIVGYFKSGNIKRCDVTADINAKAHNDNVSQNGWYGATELSEDEIADSMKKCKVTVK